MEPLYYLIHRECRYVSDSATRRRWRAGGTERELFLSWGQWKLAGHGAVRKRRDWGEGVGKEMVGRPGVDSATQRYRGRPGKLGRGWSESSLSRGQAATQ